MNKFKVGDYVSTNEDTNIIEFGVIDEIWESSSEDYYGIKNGKYWWVEKQLKRIDIPKIPKYFNM